jgi:lysine 6-dehydrogenase
MKVLKLLVEGTKEDKKSRYFYDLLDRYDPSTKIHSMAGTTGYATTLTPRMIAQSVYKRKGISAPELAR